MLKKYITYLETVKRYSAHTVLAYQKDIEQFAEFLSNQYEVEAYKDATFAMARTYVVELIDSGIKPTSVNRKISSINSLYRFLIKNDWAKKNPMAQIQSVKTPKNLVNTISQSEIDNLLDKPEYFTENLAGKRSRAIIELLYATGIRRSELINLQQDDVDLNAAQIRVLGKGNKTRIVPFAAPVKEVLLAYQKEQPRNTASSAHFFLTNNQRKLYPKFVYNEVKRYLSFVSTAPKKSPHILRHTYATHLLNSGADVNSIKELLGHANLSATQIYTHNSYQKLKETYNNSHPRETKSK